MNLLKSVKMSCISTNEALSQVGINCPQNENAGFLHIDRFVFRIELIPPAPSLRKRRGAIRTNWGSPSLYDGAPASSS